jgi:hypothetical protein
MIEEQALDSTENDKKNAEHNPADQKDVSTHQSSISSKHDSSKGEQKLVSEEEGLKSAENIFKDVKDRPEDSAPDEDKEFVKYLRFRKRAKDLGIDESSFTTIYQGGVHIADSTIENSGSFVGGDQTTRRDPDVTGGFSGKHVGSSSRNGDADSIETVFDQCDSVEQRSFMITLAALNGCNYRTVIGASQQLLLAIQPKDEVDLEDEGQQS